MPTRAASTGDAELPSAKRRLAALLRDEEYGPKLARLRGAREREVLDLVYQNKGRDARRRLNELDAERRLGRTTRDRAKRYAGLGHLDRRRQWGKYAPDSNDEFWSIYNQLK